MDQRWRVLVVDDSLTTARVVEAVARKCGFEDVELATDGPSAFAKMCDRRFDLVICDWEMAPVDGVTLLRQMRGTHSLADTRFILMSAKKDPRWVIAAKEAGADALLPKPFDSAALNRKLETIRLPQFLA